MKKKILYVEDEPSLGKIVTETLENQGFEVMWEVDGKFVLRRLEEFCPDICILDIMLPNTDGYTLCSHIAREHPELPVIFLTARTGIPDLVKGFDSGGTDYVRKPFSMEELIVRINNQLNLKSGSRSRKLPATATYQIGRFTFNPGRYELSWENGLVKLSQREIEVLNILASNINKVTDRQDLLLAVWGDDSFFNSRNLDVYIRKLRKYFSADPAIHLQTLKGKGYLFLVPERR